MTELEIIREAIANRADMELREYRRKLELFGGTPLFATVSSEHSGYMQAMHEALSIVDEAIFMVEACEATARDIESYLNEGEPLTMEEILKEAQNNE